MAFLKFLFIQKFIFPFNQISITESYDTVKVFIYDSGYKYAFFYGQTIRMGIK